MSGATYLPLPEGSDELRYLREPRAALGGVLPRRPERATVLPAQPDARVFEEFDAWSSGRATSTTVVYTRLLRGLMPDPEIGPRVVPVVPDEGRSFGFEVLYSEFGIYAPGGQRYTPVDAVRFPPDRRGIDNEDRDAREAEEVRPGVP